MIQFTAHSFSFEQIQFLNRGPTYIVPGQLHLFLCHREELTSLNTILKQLYTPLRKQIDIIFSRYSLDLIRQQLFRRAIEQQFFELFSTPIPNSIKERALYEQTLLQSIYIELKENDFILRRTADNFNTFYLDHREHFNRMTQYHLQTSRCFKLVDTFNINNPVTLQAYVLCHVRSMDERLQKLEKYKFIRTQCLKKLQIANQSNITLPYLYFLPVYNNNNSEPILQPRLTSCRNAPTRTIAQFLDRLLRPLYENSVQSTRLLDGHDFIYKLEYFTQSIERFTADTQFVTFQLHNLYTRVSHQDLLNALYGFLNDQLLGKHIEWLSIETVVQLVQFFLENHLFIYEDKIYRYIKGSPLNYSLTPLLFDIFIQQWHQILLRQIRLKNQFFGRYHNIGIFTWNKSNDTEDDLPLVIKQLNEQNADIQLTISQGKQVHFLDAHIENDNGQFRTRVYHNHKQQPFLLPYTAEHPRKFHRQWFRFRMARAIQYCPLFDDFQDEYIHIQLTFLANGYSLEFLEYLWKQFRIRFKSLHNTSIHNQGNYKSFRIQVIRYYFFKRDEAKRNYEQERLVSIPGNISLFYLYDWGNRVEFNRKFFELWWSIAMKDSKFAQYISKIILRSKHCYSLHTLFIQYHHP